jgi:hypothetical protein
MHEDVRGSSADELRFWLQHAKVCTSDRPAQTIVDERLGPKVTDALIEQRAELRPQIVPQPMLHHAKETRHGLRPVSKTTVSTPRVLPEGSGVGHGARFWSAKQVASPQGRTSHPT